jgi:succinoglycan biosynthesis protein ExoV
MILYRWQGTTANFGDELNTIIWPRLLPGFFDDDPGVRFLGIGSVLDCRHPPHVLKLVAGTGYGGYQPKPSLDRNWVIHWVRGPRTAATLGLPVELALGDPAALLPLVLRPPATGGADIGFMPHFESVARGAWTQAAAMAGIVLIDPRDPPLTIINAIGRCRLLLSEALHGVIVADALRVPWIAIRPLAAVHRPKWSDWSDMMKLTIRWQCLPASSVREWIDVSGVGLSHRGRLWLERHGPQLEGIAAHRLVARAANALRHAASASPQLSATAELQRCQARMMEALAELRREPFPGWSDMEDPQSKAVVNL